MGWLGDIASGLVGGLLDKVAPEVGGYFREKQAQKHEIELEKLRGKAAWEMAKTERAIKSEGRDHEWEMQSLLTHSKGWKDELVLIVLTIPAVLSFTPWAYLVEDGFAALAVTPLWYQLLITAVYFAVYGIRVYRRDNQRSELLEMLARHEPKGATNAGSDESRGSRSTD